MSAVQGPPAGTADEVRRLRAGVHRDPHQLLGVHPQGKVTVVRAFNPEATAISVAYPGGIVPMKQIDQGGLFEAEVPAADLPGYRLRVHTADHDWEVDDPYRFMPTLGELDLHLIGEGTHRRLWERLGARVIDHQGVRGTAFSVWAPNAQGVALVSDSNAWDDRTQPMRTLGASGVWELFIPNVGAGQRYKFRVIGADGKPVLKADPLARSAESPPGTASVVTDSAYEWADREWMTRRPRGDRTTEPLNIYEVHLGSWRRGAGDAMLGYREIAPQLADYCRRLAFTHVELLPIAEHPFGGSWGYQVSSYYAPTARYGTPDDLRWFVDHLHQNGIGVIVDWVPAHFPRDEWALAHFDGTALYEHADPRRGAQPDWGTLVFNFGRNEVRNFLVANALYWVEEFHIDGLRVDAVASMLYLDYSRKPGQWLPNEYGGRENLEAIAFIREFNDQVHGRFPGVMTIAEESTAWPAVSRPTASGGLGFTFKWNMGWMHDTLDYISKDTIFRRYHHQQLTFGVWYAWAENFILPLSHDEVVHLKRSLIGKTPGDRWQQFANLRALFGWMYAHPGKKLLFMGGELAQWAEWDHDRSLDWHLLELPEHAAVQRLVADIGRVYSETAALWQVDGSSEGFRWIDAGNVDQSVLSFVRMDGQGRPGLACVANFSPAVYHGFRVGLPVPGAWREVINTDAVDYGGSGQGNMGKVETEPMSWHGFDQSAGLTVPPLGVVWLAPGE
ncbi:MAG TPA: 1,4-alpha-glucan branching protein GlgB [Candidatus Dormibacteraeota bacterium]|nr:1,4-alpha-glucan branching protein GlgB [Candidatus Dormibacteraeota bacterium]